MITHGHGVVPVPLKSIKNKGMFFKGLNSQLGFKEKINEKKGESDNKNDTHATIRL